MTSPPFRYICKHCGYENWLMPPAENALFYCEKCEGINLIKYIWITSYWRVKRIDARGFLNSRKKK